MKKLTALVLVLLMLAGTLTANAAGCRHSWFYGYGYGGEIWCSCGDHSSGYKCNNNGTHTAYEQHRCMNYHALSTYPHGRTKTEYGETESCTGTLTSKTDATCTQDGYTVNECSGCGDEYRSDNTERFGHLTEAWQYAENDVHGRACLRGCGFEEEAVCEPQKIVFDFELETERSYVICPVCGKVSAENDEAYEVEDLAYIGETDAEMVEEPEAVGMLTVRKGFVEEEIEVLSVAFEVDGELRKPEGVVRVMLPAEVVEEYCLLLSRDGVESEIAVTVEEDVASFELDFRHEEEEEGWFAALIRMVKVEA